MSQQLSSHLVDPRPRSFHADGAVSAIEDPETEPAAVVGGLPSDLEEFAAAPRDES